MDVISRVRQAASPELLAHAASLTGLSSDEVEKGLSAAIPAVLAALVQAGEEPDGPEALDRALARGGNVGDDAAVAAAAGTDQLADLVGGKAVATLAQALGAYVGTSETTSWSLLGLAGTLSLAALGAEAGDRGGTWVRGLLEGAKDSIGEAMPAGFSDALRRANQPAGIETPPPAAAPPAAPKRPWAQWAAGLVAVAILVWLASLWLAPAPEPVAGTAPTAPGARAPTEVDVAAGVRGALEQVTAAFAKIGSETSAKAALPELAAARHTLASAQVAAAALPQADRAALASLVADALPGIRATADRLLADPAVADAVKPVLDDVLAQLDALGG